MPKLTDWIGEQRKIGTFGFGQWQSGTFSSNLNSGLWHEKLGTIWAIVARPGHPPQYDFGARSVEWVKKLDQKKVGDPAQVKAYANRLLELAGVRRGFVFDAEIAALSKFVTGTGIAHPIENGFAWHRTLGTPYLPGSGVKGTTLALARDWKGLGDTDRDTLRRIFGTAPGDTHKGQAENTEADASSGTVVFLDAVPVAPPMLSAQILTPHGKGSGAPDDAGKVIPNGFLAVKSGTFRFALLPNSIGRTSLREAIGDCRMARNWLRLALEWTGVGAKTKSNYGRFGTFSDRLCQPAPPTDSAMTS
jgi:CRISPR-associated protein Cmr6